MSFSDLFDLRGRCALITGGSRGIGREIALTLAELGADVAVSCDGGVDEAEAVANEAIALGVRGCGIAVSLADVDGAARTFQQSSASLGKIDILVLNASLQLPHNWADVTREQFELQVNINLRASLELMQLATAGMIERVWGRMLTIGSVQEVRPHPDMIVYAATKCAQASMARNLAKQLAPRGITVNNISPGVIDTDRSRARLTDSAYRAKVLASIPAGRLGYPIDIAAAAALICCEAGGYINGANLFVDGGMQL